MTDAEILFAINSWQTDPRVHPLTCGFNPRHQPLEGVVTDTGVELRCPECEYRQTNIPDAVLRAHPIDDPRR
jgi:hypothetical protein